MQHGGAANANDTRGETGRKKNTQENNIEIKALCTWERNVAKYNYTRTKSGLMQNTYVNEP